MAKKSKAKSVKVSLSSVFLVLAALTAIAGCFMFLLTPLNIVGGSLRFDTSWEKIYFGAVSEGFGLVELKGATAAFIGFIILGLAGILLIVGALMKKRGVKLLFAVLSAVMLIVGGFLIFMVRDIFLEVNSLSTIENIKEYIVLGTGPIIGVCLAGVSIILDVIGTLVK